MTFLKRCWQKRWFRRLTWTGVTIVTFYALLCTWANWSGARQWRAVQAMLKAEGETLDFRATMNEPIPESENFCAIPLLKDIALVVDNDTNKGEPAEKRKRLDALKLPLNGKIGERPRLANPALGKRTDLNAWADWLRKEGSLPMPADSGDAARDVLAALAKHDAALQELAAGLNRTKAQWTPEWKTRELPENLFSVALPQYSISRGVNLCFRASAAARVGEVVKAHEAALIMARFCQADLNEPFLIGLLVAIADTSFLCGSTWELCDGHAGTAEDFARLEAALTGLDLHRSALHAWRSELAGAVNTLQYMKRHRSEIAGLLRLSHGLGPTSPDALSQFAVQAIPSGLFDANASVLAEHEFRFLLKPLRDQGWLEARRASREWETQLIEMRTEIWRHPSYFMTSLIAPALGGIINKVIYAQTIVNQAVIACALERLRIEMGSYPDSLDAVRLADGKALPPDPMDGKPMRYRKTPDGKYALWSIGFDGKDDGGKRVLDEKKAERTLFNDEKYVGDWVWDFSAE